MKGLVAVAVRTALAAAAALLVSCASNIGAAFPEASPDDPSIARGMQTAVFAGGCFWGVEGVFERLRGVKEAVSGYSGGDASTAQYGRVSTNEGQKASAESSIEAMRAAKTFSRPIVTQVIPLMVFYAAEGYHQHFMDRNPHHPCIMAYDRPKVAALMRTYADLVASPD
jgi:peptide-methionine (S)-S-oxide reductase